MKIAEIEISQSCALNGGSFSLAGKHLSVVTDPGSGAYSVIVPIAPSTRYEGAAVFRCHIDVQEGTIGIATVEADNKFIWERVASLAGLQQLDLFVPSLQRVGGILIRNAATTLRPSRADISIEAAKPLAAEDIVSMPKPRRSSEFQLPLRTYLSGGPDGGVGGYSIVAQTFDTATAAAVVVDAWDEISFHRNICDKLAPTLAALRLIGMPIIHAPHDRSLHPSVRPLDGESVIPGEIADVEFVAGALCKTGIKRLIYMGYHSNQCILFRSLGMLAMKKRDFSVALVRDASLASETKESVRGHWLHRSVVNLIESQIGATVSAAEVQAAVAEAVLPFNSTTMLARIDPAEMVVHRNWVAAGAVARPQISGIRVITPPVRWHYAALLPLNVTSHKHAKAPCWLRIMVKDVVGHPMVSLFNSKTKELRAERPVPTSVEEILIRVPDEIACDALLFRNGDVDAVSSVTCLGAEIVSGQQR